MGVAQGITAPRACNQFVAFTVTQEVTSQQSKYITYGPTL